MRPPVEAGLERVQGNCNVLRGQVRDRSVDTPLDATQYRPQLPLAAYGIPWTPGETKNPRSFAASRVSRLPRITLEANLVGPAGFEPATNRL